MKRDSILTWSGPAITAKLFLPIMLLIIGAIIAAPQENAWTGTWNLFVATPIAGLAIWLFANIVELRPADGGVCYRKWIRWNFLPLNEITNVVRVFPCFAALIKRNGRKLYFLPDPDVTRHLRALSDRSRNDDGMRMREQTSWRMQILVIISGVVAGILVRLLDHSLPDHNAESHSTIVRVEHRYLPLFVGASLIYLIISLAGRRLRGFELYIALALTGLGSAYVCDLFLRVFKVYGY